MAIGLDDEVAAAAFDQVDPGIGVLFLDSSGQTDRLRLVASNYAVLDGYQHPTTLMRLKHAHKENLRPNGWDS
ncbi:MAG: hypothetical protein AAFV29_07350 [Myxococcota bacterium]